MADRGETPELSDEEIAAEQRFLEGLPRVNLGALLMPGIWGPAHGLWVCILFYPLWLFADNTFYGAFTQRTTLSVILALVVFVLLVAVQVVLGILSQPYAWHRAYNDGVSKEDYLKREKVWACCMALVCIVFVVIATYYNLAIRPTVEA